MRCFIVLSSLAFVFIASATANDDLSCPFNSKGTHPKCICNDDNPYDEINRICATILNANFLLSKCPKGSDGKFPACICGDGKVYVPERDECVEIDRSKCPKGSKRVNNKCVCETVNEFRYEFDEIFWICRPWYLPTTRAPTTVKPCPLHQHRVGDICDWDHCPVGYISKSGYWPDCVRPPTCNDNGMIGEYPKCYARVVEVTCGAHKSGVYPDCHWQPCPAAYITKTGFWPDCAAPPSCSDLGMTGTYPNCVKIPPTCPQYYRRNSDGECVRIECPPGLEGDFQPNCKLVPKCPSEYPGEWPNCNIYATTPSNNENSRTTTQRITTTPRTTTPRTTTPLTTITTTTVRTTTRRPTLRTTPFFAPTYLPPSTTTTPKPTTTPTRPNKCYCDCTSDEIVIFRDNVVRDPSKKYKRYINQKHLNQD